MHAPDPINLNDPEQWPSWIISFEHYRLPSKLSDEEDKHQVNTLMYLLRDIVDDILSSFKLTNEQSVSYNTVKAKFDGYFAVRKTLHTHKLSSINGRQLANEPVEEFFFSLHRLVEPVPALAQSKPPPPETQQWALFPPLLCQ